MRIIITLLIVMTVGSCDNTLKCVNGKLYKRDFRGKVWLPTSLALGGNRCISTEDIENEQKRNK